MDNLSGADPSSEQRRRYHPLMVEKYLDAAFSNLLGQPDRREEGLGSWKLDALTKVYQTKAVCDQTRKKSYFVLPAKIVPLMNLRHIRQISAIQDEGTDFVPRTNNMSQLFKEGDGEMAETHIAYWQEHDKVYFARTLKCDMEDILVKLVVRFTEFADEEEIYLPADKEQLILDEVFATVKRKPFEDTLNDNSNMPTG
jgi:hypothetical protein